MKKTVIALLLAVCAGTAGAADTYGYLVMWQNPADSGSAVQLKTTKENASQLEANAELEAFCRAQDTLSGVQQGQATGCKSVIPLHNTCIALAYPKAQGGLTAENVVAITSPRFKSVHQTALNQCIKKYGTQGQCGLEIAYCTSADLYSGQVRAFWNRLKLL